MVKEEKKSNAIQRKTDTANVLLRTKVQIPKYRNNIKEVMRWSNATPIRRYGDMGFMCCYCPEQYQEPADLKRHTLNSHPDVRKAYFITKLTVDRFVIRLDITGLQCKICFQNIDTLEELMDHLVVEHQKTIYTDIKNQITPLKFTTEMFQCYICTNTFNKYKLLLQHMNVHYRNYICEVCDMGFVNMTCLRNHSLTHRIGSFTCDYCPQIFDTVVKKKSHEKSHTLGQVHKCAYCTETFTEYRLKEKHLVTIHGLKLPTYKCQACDKVFTCARDLTKHTKKDHLLERRHQCSECDKKFFKASDLKDHMAKHTGLKEFKCTVCSKCFSRAKTLREHKKIHDNVRRFKCEYCGQAFVQKCSWRGHMKSKHGEIV